MCTRIGMTNNPRIIILDDTALRIDTHLFDKVPRPGDSERIFSVLSQVATLLQPVKPEAISLSDVLTYHINDCNIFKSFSMNSRTFTVILVCSGMIRILFFI